jgi:hypothetical protein
MLQAGANRRMLDFVILDDVLDPRVRHPRVIFEEGRQAAACDVTRLVNRCGEHGSAMFPVPNGIIGSTTEK